MASISKVSRGFRKITSLTKRTINRIDSYFNRVKLLMYGVSYGRNCVIQGKAYVKLSPTAVCKIGDNFYFSSGRCINALCANRLGAIYATDNASVIIGNNVGMSSTVL